VFLDGAWYIGGIWVFGGFFFPLFSLGVRWAGLRRWILVRGRPGFNSPTESRKGFLLAQLRLEKQSFFETVCVHLAKVLHRDRMTKEETGVTALYVELFT
jgi:hypothetical protein